MVILHHNYGNSKLILILKIGAEIKTAGFWQRKWLIAGS